MRKLLTALVLLIPTVAWGADWQTVVGNRQAGNTAKAGHPIYVELNPTGGIVAAAPEDPSVVWIQGIATIRYYNKTSSTTVRVFGCDRPSAGAAWVTANDCLEELCLDWDADGDIDATDCGNTGVALTGDDGSSGSQRHAIYDVPPGFYFVDASTNHDGSRPTVTIHVE